MQRVAACIVQMGIHQKHVNPIAPLRIKPVMIALIRVDTTMLEFSYVCCNRSRGHVDHPMSSALKWTVEVKLVSSLVVLLQKTLGGIVVLWSTTEDGGRQMAGSF